MEKYQIKTGYLLVAEPFMLDPNFKRAVVLLCEHSKEGSLGFIINRPLDVHVHELVKDLPDFGAQVFFGGPVQTDTIHYLHNVGDLLGDSREVAQGVYWGGDFQKLKSLIKTGMVTTDNIRFFLGYAGWDHTQLLGEFDLGTWVLAPMFPNYLFKTAPKKLWPQVLEHKGENYAVIATMPDSAVWN